MSWTNICFLTVIWVENAVDEKRYKRHLSYEFNTTCDMQNDSQITYHTIIRQLTNTCLQLNLPSLIQWRYICRRRTKRYKISLIREFNSSVRDALTQRTMSDRLQTNYWWNENASSSSLVYIITATSFMLIWHFHLPYNQPISLMISIFKCSFKISNNRMLNQR